MAKGYITGTERFPQGPQPGTGLSDVQIVENIDLIFGDNEELKFGDASDVSVKWNASNLVILPVADLTGAILIGNGTLSMDLKVFGTTDAHYMEWDASADVLNIVIADKVIVGKQIALDIAYTAIVGSGDYAIGCRSQVTPTGAAAEGGAVYAMAFQGILTMAGANRSATGYACGAEFRLVMSGTFDPPDCAVLVLTSENDTTGSQPTVAPYIMLREYGDQAANAFARFYDATRASASNAVIVSQTGMTPFDTTVRCMVGTTPVWLLGSTVGPATTPDLKFVGSTTGNYIEWDSSGNVFNMVKAGIAFSGAMPATGLDFGSATFTAGADYNVLSYGDDGAAVTLSITGDVMVIRMSIISAADPGSDKGFAFFSLLFSQTTEAQDHLYIQGMRMHLDLSQDVKFVFGVDAYVDVVSSLTVEGFIGAGKFTIDLTSGATVTYHDAAVILAQVTGSGANSCSGPAAAELCLLMLKVAADSTIGSMITFFTIAGCTVTNGIYVGTGVITNFLNFESGNVGSAKVGAYSANNQDSDGLIRILVDGTAYFIPFYGVGKVTGEW